tara:strand:+ start:263 stop:550 length:288 start_codon:yes stop_codon:yes gene_type:complete
MKTKQEIPKWFNGDIYDKGEEVFNRFGGDSCHLNNLELSIYDFIMGATMYLEHIPTSIKVSGNMQQKNKDLMKDLIKAIDWFKYNNPKAYMVLLD